MAKLVCKSNFTRKLVSIPQAFELAVQHHQAGRLAEAEAICRQILAADPRHADAFHLLGVIARRMGRSDVAVELIRQAIAIAPKLSVLHSSLGNALCDQGRFDEAITAYRRAIQIEPNLAETHSNLGNALSYQGRTDEAIAAYHRAIQLKPGFAEAHYNLGNALRDKGRIEQAFASYGRAIQLKPDYVTAHINLGNALTHQGRLDEAVAAYRKALELEPDYMDTHYNLGIALAHQGRLDEAVATYGRALELRPDYPDAHINLGNALKDASQLDEAIVCYRRAMSIEPHNSHTHSNLIYALHFHPAQDAVSIHEEHCRWERQFAEPLRKFFRPHANDRDPERRLRIGYVSPDFWHHVICHFLTPLLESHDHAAFEIFCYASVKRPDAITARMKKSAAVWRDVLGVRDDALAELIREDRIDILVDLTQHMADNRLSVFARKPAPVQVAWLGYPGSTGLSAMDCRLTDARMDPEGAPWADSVEAPVRLPDSWFCFDPIDEYPEPSALPALQAGHVTFGCLNNFCKVNEAVLKLWVAVLQSVEGSRLVMQCPAGETQARVRQWFEAQGIAAHRLELVSHTAARAEFLRHFERIDLALETFPYNGGTTTCEALWMGVPAPSFPGASAVARIGLSILSAAGLPELIAVSQADYLRLIVTLAADLPRLAELRATLRVRMKASAFMDAPRFARNVEHTYRQMWRRWCGVQSSLPPA